MANMFGKILVRSLGLCLVISTAVSCTYDYFVDETNFKLHVLQIENEEIENFYVSFHSKDGSHVITRQVTLPSDKVIRGGILKFKVPAGDYDVTCFANYTPDMVTEGEHLSESHKRATLLDSDYIYHAGTANPRVLFMRSLSVYPLGHPGAENVVDININESRCFKGNVVCRFEGMPENITGVVVHCKGPGTRFGFDGVFSSFLAHDKYRHEFVSAECRETRGSNDVVCSTSIYPSAGVAFDPSDPLHTDAGQELELQIDLYMGDHLTGTATVTAADIAQLSEDSRPVDASGNPLEELVLYPQQTITYTFKDFLLTSVSLESWGDIIPGQVDMQ